MTLWTRKALMWVTIILSVSMVITIIILAFYWAKTTNHFNLTKIKLAGYNYIDDKEILQLIEIPQSAVLTEIDLIAIQEKLVKHPYIKATRVSRDFPSTLCIDVIERSPIAYINHSPFLLVDNDGVVLPVRNGRFEFDIPTLSGFNPASELYPIGKRCLSQKILEAVNFLNLVYMEFPHFYGDISEVTVNALDEYVLCLSQYPTKIYLGSAASAWQIQLLRQFQDTITGIRTLHDYKYVDLRYDKQIVVKEKA